MVLQVIVSYHDCKMLQISIPNNLGQKHLEGRWCSHAIPAMKASHLSHEDISTLFTMQQVDRLRKNRRPVSRLIGFVAIKLDKELLFPMRQLQI
jgi:hypothetical protein